MAGDKSFWKAYDVFFLVWAQIINMASCIFLQSSRNQANFQNRKQLSTSGEGQITLLGLVRQIL